MRILYLLLPLLLLSCQIHFTPQNTDELSVATWNVQTFFDSTRDGTEYSEFLTSRNWNKEAYIQRLKRLTEAMKKIDAQIFVMQEIENESVVQDISNFLSGEWDMRKIYSQAFFSKEEGSSIGCAVFSRVPLTQIKTHYSDIRTQEQKQPLLRPVIELCADTGTNQLYLLINHWKSKSGGQKQTEMWRDTEESIICECLERLSSKNASVIVLGDFNRDLNDFCIKDNIVTFRKQKNSQMLSTGQTVNAIEYEKGSYYYKNKWSRIDNIFWKGNISLKNYGPVTSGPWCSESGIPKKYYIDSGTGYSDHLPLYCIVSFD